MAISVETKNGQLHIRDGEKLYRLNPESIGMQIKLTAQNGVEQADVQAELEAIHTKIEAVDAIARRTSWRGSVNSESEIPNAYEAGDRWVVATPGVYKGQTLETGEIIVAIASRQGSGNQNSDPAYGVSGVKLENNTFNGSGDPTNARFAGFSEYIFVAVDWFKVFAVRHRRTRQRPRRFVL